MQALYNSMKLIYVGILVAVMGCKSKGNTESNGQESGEREEAQAMDKPLPFETAAARSFLISAIENCFNNYDGNYSPIVTKQYKQLLVDGLNLLNLQMEGDKNEAAVADKYQKKWEKAYGSIGISYLYPDV